MCRICQDNEWGSGLHTCSCRRPYARPPCEAASQQASSRAAAPASHQHALAALAQHWQHVTATRQLWQLGNCDASSHGEASQYRLRQLGPSIPFMASKPRPDRKLGISAEPNAN